jgi:hypothetical protein
MAEAQKRPEQERSRDQDRPMKERFETVLCQKGKPIVRGKPLSRPKKNWSEQRCYDNDSNKIDGQFSYVFQGG